MRTPSPVMRAILSYVIAVSGITAPLHHARAESGPRLVSKETPLKDAPPVWKWVLPNGLTVLLLPDARNPMTSLKIALNAGSNREKKGETGLAHFFEHMMFRKTKSTEEGHYDRVLASVGGNGNAFTGPSYVVYLSQFPAPALDQILELEAQRFTELELKEPYFSTEKGAVISERKLRYENNPLMRGFEQVVKILERDTPYEWMTIGTKQDVENMSLQAAQTFYENYYRPQNAVLAIGGPIDPEKTIKKVFDKFGKWEQKSLLELPTIPENKTPKRDIGKSIVCSEPIFEQEYELVYPSSDRSQKSLLLAKAFEWLVNEHKEGTFLQRLQNQKLANDFNIEKRSWRPDSSPVEVSFSLPRNVEFKDILAFWEKEVNNTLERRFDDTIKQKILKSIEISQAIRLEKMSSLLEHIYWQELIFKDYRHWYNELELTKNLTEKELKKWITENIRKDNLVVTGVTGKKDFPSCAELSLNNLKSESTKK